MKYTREDFEQAKFAEHEDGRRAVRTSTPIAPWIMEMRNGPGRCARDGEMAADGWVPVPDKPTITQSEFDRAVRSSSTIVSGVKPKLLIELLGIEIVPDPEPTNTDRLREIIEAIRKDQGRGILIGDRCDSHILAELLNERNVNVKDN